MEKSTWRHFGRGDKRTITLDYLALLDLILPHRANKEEKLKICRVLKVEPRAYVVFCPTYKGRKYVSLLTLIKDKDKKLKRGIVGIDLNGDSCGVIATGGSICELPFIVLDEVANLIVNVPARFFNLKE